jgi:glutathione S-transferase
MQASARAAARRDERGHAVAEARLTISSKNYSSWSLRGWLMTKMSEIDFEEEIIPPTDPSMRAELLLLSPSMLVPCLRHDGLVIWNNLAIGEYLHEINPDAGLLPADRAKRARCRSISGEMHSGFAPLRSALPMNLKGDFPTFRVWSRAQADIDRITAIWRDCLDLYGGPYLLGAAPCMADAMYAPVVTRLNTYHVPVDDICRQYCDTITAMPTMTEWVAAAKQEPEDVEELEVEF